MNAPYLFVGDHSKCTKKVCEQVQNNMPTLSTLTSQLLQVGHSLNSLQPTPALSNSSLLVHQVAPVYLNYLHQHIMVIKHPPITPQYLVPVPLLLHQSPFMI